MSRAQQHTGSPESGGAGSRSSSASDKVRTPVAVGRFRNVVRHGLLAMLHKSSDLSVVGESLDEPGLESILATTDAVVLLDAGEVPATASRLRAGHPDLALVVLARQPTLVYGRTLLAFGVSCLDSDVSAQNLVTAIHDCYFGRQLFLVGNHREGYDTGIDPPLLTPKELALLALLNDRKSYEEIARTRGLSVSTVKAHAASIRAKLGADSRSELADLPLLAVTPPASSSTMDT